MMMGMIWVVMKIEKAKKKTRRSPNRGVSLAPF
jgi:hypothetical protein